MKKIFAALFLISILFSISVSAAPFGIGEKREKVSGILKVAEQGTTIVAVVHTDDKQLYRLDRINYEKIKPFAGQRVEVEGTVVKPGSIAIMRVKKIKSLDVPPKSLLDAVVNFYISPIPNPPEIKTDVRKVIGLVDTGDIIIENNRAFPQWYVIIGSLVPGTRYVHAGMILKGHEILSLNSYYETLTKEKNSIKIYRRSLVEENQNGKTVKVWQWLPSDAIDINKPYVITPEVVAKEKVSRVVAIDIEHYLSDPKGGHPTKHIQVLRPAIKNQQQRQLIKKFLGYSLYKKIEYDMGYTILEPNPAFRVENQDAVIDLSVAPVPMYCTEMIFRAFKETINMELPTTQVDKRISGILEKIPGVPRGLIEKLKSPFVTADCFIKKAELIYKNSDSPPPDEVLQSLVSDSFKKFCVDMKVILYDFFNDISGD
ncbi:MAG: hypothetical protein HQM10_14095 [Candidatus Riflebacteria bacterium]|nr:hypothetical protein [Candidatus Riflebacteria bacterium]